MQYVLNISNQWNQIPFLPEPYLIRDNICKLFDVLEDGLVPPDVDVSQHPAPFSALLPIEIAYLEVTFYFPYFICYQLPLHKKAEHYWNLISKVFKVPEHGSGFLYNSPATGRGGVEEPDVGLGHDPAHPGVAHQSPEIPVLSIVRLLMTPKTKIW